MSATNLARNCGWKKVTERENGASISIRVKAPLDFLQMTRGFYAHDDDEPVSEATEKFGTLRRPGKSPDRETGKGYFGATGRPGNFQKFPSILQHVYIHLYLVSREQNMQGFCVESTVARNPNKRVRRIALVGPNLGRKSRTGKDRKVATGRPGNFFCSRSA